MISGRIRDTVKLKFMDNQWQQKKSGLGIVKKEMTAEEKQIMHFQKQLEDIRESNKYAGIYNKINSGDTLTAQEIDYLRKNNPQALQAYEASKAEQKVYERKLRSCRTKDEVDELKVEKMSEFMAEVKQASSNPNIPKAKKLEIMSRIMGEVSKIAELHYEFTHSPAYKNLPTREEKRAEMEEKYSSDTQTEKTEVEENMAGETSDIDNVSKENEGTDTEAKTQETKVQKEKPEVTFEQVKQEIKDFLQKEGSNKKKIDVLV